MGQEHRIELRTPDKLWATWYVSDAGMLLRHDLDDLSIAMCPGLWAYENGRRLRLAQGSQLILTEPNGQVCLQSKANSINGPKCSMFPMDIVSSLGIFLRSTATAKSSRRSNVRSSAIKKFPSALSH